MGSSGRKPILIAGAGLSSLLFAQALKRAAIPFRLYERDASLSFRAQGYRLRLSSEGLDAIEAVLSPDHFARFWDACGKTAGAGATTLNARTFEECEPWHPQPSGPSKSRPGLASRDGKTIGISRGEMRRIFMDGCEDNLQFGRNVTGYELTADGVRLRFADGTTSDEGDMLVGGEGIYSKVAKQLSKGAIKTYDTGARGIHGQAPAPAFKGLSEGVFSLVDDSRDGGKVAVVTNVRAGDKDKTDVQLGWTMVGQAGVLRPPNDDYAIIGKPAADIAKSLTEEWHPRLKPLFDQMNEGEAAFWKFTCSTPTGVVEWENEPRVTVLGDAVHSMTPAGGIGANTAMRDSALLGRLVAEAGGYAPGVTAAYEKGMRVYASEAVASSYGMAKFQFGVEITENSPTV